MKRGNYFRKEIDENKSASNEAQRLYGTLLATIFIIYVLYTIFHPFLHD